MASTMIRVQRSTRKKLRALARQTGETIPNLVTAAVEDLDRKLFWKRVNREFATLRDNTAAWKQEVEERIAWGVMLSATEPFAVD